MKIKSDGAIGFIFLILVALVLVINSSKAERQAYKDGYAAAQEEYSVDEDEYHRHVQIEIEKLIDNGTLVYKEDVFDEYEMEEIYYDALHEGYVQGYGDCYYGNERELNISKYKDEDMF